MSQAVVPASARDSGSGSCPARSVSSRTDPASVRTAAKVRSPALSRCRSAAGRSTSVRVPLVSTAVVRDHVQAVAGGGEAEHVEPVRARWQVVRGLHGQRRAGVVEDEPDRVGAGAVEPGRRPRVQVATGRRADRGDQVVERRAAPLVVAEVRLQAGDEGVLADVGRQLLQHALALGVGDRVEVRHRLRDVRDVGADRVRARPHVGAVALELGLHEGPRPGVDVLGGTRRRPGGGPRRERLVQPQVVPPQHRHHVAEPHVRHLVQQHVRAHRALGVARRRPEQDGVGPGDAAPVLHRPTHVRDEHLVVPRAAGRAARTSRRTSPGRGR